MKCIICKKDFEPKPRNKTKRVCSRSCNAVYATQSRLKNYTPPRCLECGKETFHDRKRKYCSIECASLNRRAEKHHNWKGGKRKHSEGYVYLLDRDHPFSDLENRIMEHRVIFERWLEENEPDSEYLIEINGRKYLRNGVVIHHINGEKHDNRIKNLKIYKNQKEHIKDHSLKDKYWFGRNR